MTTGVILCGGKSSRMGTDKAFISYHGVPQYQYIANMLSGLCNNIVLSCNNNQTGLFSCNYSVVTDNEQFADGGPLTGILSVIHKIKPHTILLVGCDYPFLAESDLAQLIKARDNTNDVVCFANDETGYLEPLLAIYEQRAINQLNTYYQKGGRSLYAFIKNLKHKAIKPQNLINIKSIDEKKHIQ